MSILRTRQQDWIGRGPRSRTWAYGSSLWLESSGEVLPALQGASKAGAQALLLIEGLFLTDKSRRETRWHSASHKLLTVATDRDFAEAALLMGLGPRRAELQEQVADYVMALLDGTPVT